MLKAIVYARVSTKEQADEGTSLDTQIDRGLAKALEWPSFASNRINVGGDEAWKHYLTWGQDRMAAFMRRLAEMGRNNIVRVRSMYVPAQPGPSQTTDWGP